MTSELNMATDPQTYTSDELQRISKLAKRRVGSDQALLFGFGGCVLFNVLFFFSPNSFVAVARMSGLSLPIAAAILSFGLSALAAYLLGRYLRPRVKEAQDIEASIQYAYKNKIEAERREKLNAMPERSGEANT